MEQIEICKAEKTEMHFGKFNTELAKYRDSSKFRLMDCEVKAGNNVNKAQECNTNYLKDMVRDNDVLFDFTKLNFLKHFWKWLFNFDKSCLFKVIYKWSNKLTSTSTKVSIVLTDTFLVILIGDVSVGKTCLLSRYLKNSLPKTGGPTIGVEFATKNVTMKDGATVKAQLWDTAG